MNVSHAKWMIVAVTLSAISGCSDRVNTREVSANLNRVDEIRSGFIGTEAQVLVIAR